MKKEDFWRRVLEEDRRRVNGEYVKPLTRKDIPLSIYLKSRIITPIDIVKGFKNPVFKPVSLGAIIFNARYNAGIKKCIPGYDFL